ncbi:MAG: hypothetical protein HQ473_06735 [Cryomorphaceae bacterium]|nr:hypothetical protein [Cryomorphaceae bacterium]
MNEIIQKVLDLPGQISGRVLGNRVSDTLDNFDSSNGIRSYFQTIYSWLALGMCILMLWGLIGGLGEYFGEADSMGMIASIVTTLICLVASFAIPNVVRLRGDSFAGKHSSMTHFLAHDVVKTNIRLLGELGALVIITQALCMAVATIFNTSVYAPLGGGESIADMFWAAPASALIPFGVLDTLGASFTLADWSASISGSWSWDSIMATLGMMVNAVILLGVFHIAAALYGVLYNVAAWIVGWVQNPHLPIKNS